MLNPLERADRQYANVVADFDQYVRSRGRFLSLRIAVVSERAAWLRTVLILRAEHAFVGSQGTLHSPIASGAVARIMVFLAAFWRLAAFRNFVTPSRMPAETSPGCELSLGSLLG
jgi:hypothetical protein